MVNGFGFRAEKNLSYIPLPKPILLKSPSTPMTGTTITSTFCLSLQELAGSKILNLFFQTGNLYFTNLKLTHSINGTYIILFRLSFGKIVRISTSILSGIYMDIVLKCSLSRILLKAFILSCEFLKYFSQEARFNFSRQILRNSAFELLLFVLLSDICL